MLVLPGVLVALLASGCGSDGPGPAPASTLNPAQATSAPAPAGPTSPAGPVSAAPTRAKHKGPSAPPTTPTPGSVTQTVPSSTQSTQKPVKPGSPSRFDPTLSATVTGITTRKVTAELPGEVSGPSVVFTVTVKNSSAKVIDLNPLVVNVLDSRSNPANRITSAPAKRMPDAVAAGGSAQGRFVFVVPKSKRDPITIEVSLSADQPVLVFRGAAK